LKRAGKQSHEEAPPLLKRSPVGMQQLAGALQFGRVTAFR